MSNSPSQQRSETKHGDDLCRHLVSGASSQQQHQRNHQPEHHPHVLVQHTYHDRCQEEPPTNVNNNELLALQRSTNTPFPIKLLEMLDRVEEEGYSYLISWQPHGRCFVIHQAQEFARVLLPRFFRLNKMSSFLRQLNLYGFGRFTQGLDNGGYYHEYFLRGKAFLAHKIQRIKVKGTGVRGKSNPDQEPRLWKMPWVGTQQATLLTSTTFAIFSNNYDAQQEQSIFANEEQRREVWNKERQVALQIDPLNHHDHRPILAITSLDPADEVLMAWGMPFHALGVLPTNEGLDKNMQRQRPLQPGSSCSNSSQTTSKNACEYKHMYLDEVLDSMIRELPDAHTDESLGSSYDENTFGTKTA